MKYVFIVGLEHSGTTLINHLLSSSVETIGLGEVASFFSPDHMNHYMDTWGEYPDVKLCSCGQPWGNCPFWGRIISLNGLNSAVPIEDKYRHMIQYIQSEFKERKIVIDSSKNISVLRTLVENAEKIGLKREDIFVVFMIKDVRSFTASILGKDTSGTALLSALRTFNWWFSVNSSTLNYLQNEGISFELVLYEKFCSDHERYCERILNKCEKTVGTTFSPEHNNSHISMGNKNFIMRNRNTIKYDTRWFLDDNINMAYILHRKVRNFNRNLYSL